MNNNREKLISLIHRGSQAETEMTKTEAQFYLWRMAIERPDELREGYRNPTIVELGQEVITYGRQHTEEEVERYVSEILSVEETGNDELKRKISHYRQEHSVQCL